MLRALIILKQAFRERQLTQHISTDIVKRILFLLSILFALILTNTLGMVLFEEMSLGDALWLSFTTVTTVGYGDFSPATFAGRAITIITMYTFSIALLSIIAAEIIESRLITTEKKRRGFWEWKGMKNHIQIINTPNEDAERYLNRLVEQMQQTPAFEGMPIQLLTRKYSEGLPDSLVQRKVLHRTGSAEDGVTLDSINILHACHVIILARDANDSLSDSVTFDTLARVIDINPSANVVVEAVLDENRSRFLKSGAKSVLRPVRAYPEIIVRAMAHPGTEQVLEDLFNIKGDSLYRLDCEFKGRSWKGIVMSCVENDIGVALGYVHNGEIVVNPKSSCVCEGNALIILVKEDCEISSETITALLNQ